MTDQEIREAYREADENFRKYRKQGQYNRAKVWKDKRDLLEPELDRILKQAKEKQA